MEDLNSIRKTLLIAIIVLLASVYGCRLHGTQTTEEKNYLKRLEKSAQQGFNAYFWALRYKKWHLAYLSVARPKPPEDHFEDGLSTYPYIELIHKDFRIISVEMTKSGSKPAAMVFVKFQRKGKGTAGRSMSFCLLVKEGKYWKVPLPSQ